MNLTEAQQQWILSASDPVIVGFFEILRKNKLNTLDTASVNLEKGVQIQNEIAALHRLETEIKQLRTSLTKQNK